MKQAQAILFCVCIAVCLAGCDGGAAPSTATPTHTALPPTAAAEVTAALSIPTAAATDEADVQSVTLDNAYFIAVNYTVDPSQDATLAGIRADQRGWIIVASLGNQTDAPVTVAAAHLTLIDAQGGEYAPQPPNDETQPPLVGLEIPAGESFVGLVLFILPAEATPARLAWCPGGACEQKIEANIP